MEGESDNNYQRYSSPTNAASNNPHHQHRTPGTPSSPHHETTPLHKACSSPSSSLSKLRATLLALGQKSACTKDENGNLPLHLLGRNELLIHLFLNQARYDVTNVLLDGGLGLGYGSSGAGGGGGGMGMMLWDDNEDWMSIGQHSAGNFGAANAGTDGGTTPGIMGGSGASRSPRTELDSFLIELVKAYPRSIICTDGNGRIPLTDAIYDWIEYSSKDHPGVEIVEEEGGHMETSGGPNRANSHLGMGSARGGRGGDDYLPSDRLEGMSQLMGQDNKNKNNRNIGGESMNTGKRSVLDNISLPSAFRSAYSASGNVDDPNYQSRASYRNVVGNNMNDPAVRQQAEFRNVWSATSPRPDGPSLDELHEEQQRSGMHGASNPGVASQQSIGQSDVVSNPPEDGAIDDIFPLNLAMPPVVEWSLRMISILLDGIEAYDGPLGDADDDAEKFNAWREGKDNGSDYDAAVTSGDHNWIGNSLVSHLASIPSFMKTLLLLNDNDPVKARVFNLSIVRRVISSKYTIGNWLVYMLEAVDPIVARRGVDYLEILSEDEDENALIPSTKRVRFAGTQLSPAARAALYYKVSKLDYFLPAILALEETSEVDRAAKTKLLRHILDKELGSSPTLTMAFFDMLFLLMLLVTFQISVYHVVEERPYSAGYAATYFLSMIGVIFAILRKFGQMSSMIKISRQAFIENNFRWVDFIDWLAILLVIGGIVWMEVTISGLSPVTDYMRSYLAAAICGVWLKLVSWLSVINWQVINLVSLFYQVSIIHHYGWRLAYCVCVSTTKQLADCIPSLSCLDCPGYSMDSILPLGSHLL